MQLKAAAGKCYQYNRLQRDKQALTCKNTGDCRPTSVAAQGHVVGEIPRQGTAAPGRWNRPAEQVVIQFHILARGENCAPGRQGTRKRVIVQLNLLQVGQPVKAVWQRALSRKGKGAKIRRRPGKGKKRKRVGVQLPLLQLGEAIRGLFWHRALRET